MCAAKNILLINDLPGYGKVALAAMVPILSRKGQAVFQLPTAVISNTLDYGKFCIQDMTDYMRSTLKVWKELGFSVDCVCTGFIVSEEQAEFIGEYINSLTSNFISESGICRAPAQPACPNRREGKKPLVMVDPIMADGGKLYNGIGPERVAAMKKLAAYADVMIPNMTEASFLTGIRPGQERGTEEQLRELTDGLRGISGKSVVITSAVKTICMENETTKENHLVYGYDHWNQEYFQVPYENLPVRVPGSGDIFSAVMTGELLDGKGLKVSVQKAVKVLADLIEENKDNLKRYKGILVERYLDKLD